VRVTYLGFGKMAQAVIPHVVKAGHTVTVWNRSLVSAEKFAGLEVTVARTAAEAVAGCDVVFTLLLNDEALTEVLYDGGVLDAIPAGAVHVSVSTISVKLAKRIAMEHARRGQQYVGAPVYGRPSVAAEGKLWTVVGGTADAVESVRPLLKSYCRGISVIDEEPWKAHMVKLMGNFMVVTMMAGLSEAMTAAELMGISRSSMVEAINSGIFRSPVYEAYGSMMLNPPKEASARIDLGEKDMRLFRDAAATIGMKAHLAELMRDNFAEGIRSGLQEEDLASGYYKQARSRYLREAGVEG
jgi:3-hydroxyisobutyrate dehydrogenase-like beta-hydroxyacid dehydrogenase